MYNNYQKKFLLPEQYLSEQIIKNKELTSDDLTVAAKLYGISKLRRHYKNISKIIYSADNIANLKGITSGEIDDDWMNYFLVLAENISDETVQNIYAYILANKFENKNGFRKVMLDRLALLDYDSAIAFLKLCQATYEIETSEHVYYSIPPTKIREEPKIRQKTACGRQSWLAVGRFKLNCKRLLTACSFFYSTSNPSRTSSSVSSISGSSVDQVSRRVMTEAVIRRTMPTMVFQ